MLAVGEDFVQKPCTMIKKDSYDPRFEENLKKLNSLKVREMREGGAFFHGILKNEGGVEDGIIDFLVRRYEFSSPKVKSSLLLLFINYRIKKAVPVFLKVLREGSVDDDMIRRIIIVIVDFQDQIVYTELSRFFLTATNKMKKAVLQEITAMDDESWSGFCFSISRMRKDERVRMLNQLAELDYSRVVRFILKSLSTVSSIRKKRYLLESFQTLGIVDGFIDLLKFLDSEKIRKSALALRKIEANLVDHFYAALTSKDDETKYKIIESLEYLGDGNTNGALKEVLEMEQNERILSKAIKVYSDYADSTDVILMGKFLLTQEDPRIRANAIEALERAGEETLDVIKSFLKDPNNRIRANAAKAVAGKAREDSVAALYGMLDESDSRMKASALWALGEIREKDAVDRISEYIDHQDEIVQNNAKSALKRIGAE